MFSTSLARKFMTPNFKEVFGQDIANSVVEKVRAHIKFFIMSTQPTDKFLKKQAVLDSIPGSAKRE